MNAAVARDVEQTVIVSEIAGGIAPGLNRVTLAVEAGLRTERGVFGELFAAIVCIELELVVEVPYEAAGGVSRLEREAGAVAKTGANRPAGLLFEGGATG